MVRDHRRFRQHSEGRGRDPGGSKVIVSEYTNVPPTTYWTTLALNPATGAKMWKKTTYFTSNGPSASAFALSPDGSTAYVTGYSDVWVTIGYSTADGTQVFSARYHGQSRNYAYANAVSPTALSSSSPGQATRAPAVPTSWPPWPTPPADPPPDQPPTGTARRPVPGRPCPLRARSSSKPSTIKVIHGQVQQLVTWGGADDPLSVKDLLIRD